MRADLNPYPPPARRPPGSPGDDLRGYAPIQPEGTLRRLGRRLIAPLIAVGALLTKFKFVLVALTKIKLFTTSASMLVSVAGYAVFWGWKFAVGFVALLFIHEMGHVLEAKRQGLATGGVYFIPFLGAVMMLKEHSQNAARAAWLGLAGPIVGGAAAAATWGIGIATDSDLFVALGYTGFLLNLFNLIPVFPLDGGWATAVFHPLFWLFGLIGLVMLFLVFPNPIILIVVAVGAFELWKRWKGRGIGDAAYHDVSGRQRVAIAGAYLALVALLGLGMSASHRERRVDGTQVASVASPAVTSPTRSVPPAGHQRPD